MITVLGATGRIGRRITASLREQDEPVRAIGRTPEGRSASATNADQR